jgi:SAM-dependent methyltransferase
MNSLKVRSDAPEMMDSPKIQRKLLQKNLAELDIFNRYLGGHSITLQGVKMLIDRNKPYEIADLGCGSGDTLKYLAHWARKKDLLLKFIGVDVNIHAIQYLKRNCMGYPEISGIVMDYSEFLKLTEPVDIYVCSLFCHHLNNEQLIELFRLLRKAKTGFVINDLHRSKAAYYSAWLFTRLFNSTVLSKNDGPVSVLKAFKRDELESLLLESGNARFSIIRKWIFRYQVVVRNN